MFFGLSLANNFLENKLNMHYVIGILSDPATGSSKLLQAFFCGDFSAKLTSYNYCSIGRFG